MKITVVYDIDENENKGSYILDMMKGDYFMPDEWEYILRKLPTEHIKDCKALMVGDYVEKYEKANSRLSEIRDVVNKGVTIR